MTLSVLVAIVAGLLTIQVHGYPNGAPTQLCTGSMIPHHTNISPQPLSTSPIAKFETKWNSDEETITVNIDSEEPLKGIYIQGRNPNGAEPIGTFINLPADTHLVQCPTGDGVTHSSRQQWQHLTLTWKKPASVKSGETIQFWGTFVVDFKHFWVVKSIE